MENFSALLTLYEGNSLVTNGFASPYKGQWRGALMFSLICPWTNGWANNRDARKLWHRCAHYDVTVMSTDCSRLQPIVIGIHLSLVDPAHKGTVMRRSFHAITLWYGTIIFVKNGIIVHRTTTPLFKYTIQHPHLHRQGIWYSPRGFMSCHEGSQCGYRCQWRASANSPCDPIWYYIQGNSWKTVSLNFNSPHFSKMVLAWWVIITMTLHECHGLKSPAARLFVEQLVQNNNQRSAYWPRLRGIHRSPLMRKVCPCFDAINILLVKVGALRR